MKYHTNLSFYIALALGQMKTVCVLFLSNTKSIFFAHSFFFPKSRQKFDLAKKFDNGFIEKVKCSFRQQKHKMSNLSDLGGDSQNFLHITNDFIL